MKITITSRQTAARVNQSRLKRLVEHFAARLQKLTPGTEWDEISLALVDDKGIAVVNSEYLGKDAATDVISFRYNSAPGEQGANGELVVNVERAVELGPKHGGTGRELALYVAHGVDHLAGEDDADDDGFRRMRRRELRWLREAEEEGLLDGILKA